MHRKKIRFQLKGWYYTSALTVHHSRIPLPYSLSISDVIVHFLHWINQTVIIGKSAVLICIANKVIIIIICFCTGQTNRMSVQEKYNIIIYQLNKSEHHKFMLAAMETLTKILQYIVKN